MFENQEYYAPYRHPPQIDEASLEPFERDRASPVLPKATIPYYQHTPTHAIASSKSNKLTLEFFTRKDYSTPHKHPPQTVQASLMAQAIHWVAEGDFVILLHYSALPPGRPKHHNNSCSAPKRRVSVAAATRPVPTLNIRALPTVQTVLACPSSVSPTCWTLFGPC